MVISYEPKAFTKVFGIPSKGDSAKKPSSRMLNSEKKRLLEEICGDNLKEEQWDSIWQNSNRRGLKKLYITSTEWRCVMDILKSKLTAISKASDIAIWMLQLMYGLNNGKVYNWGRVLSNRVKEFMLLKHKTLYIPHHVIALFLEALRTQVAPEHRGNFLATSRVEPYKPAMYYWLHLDTFEVVHTEALEKRARQEPCMEVGMEEEDNSQEEEEIGEEETLIVSSSSSDEDEGEFRFEQNQTILEREEREESELKERIKALEQEVAQERTTRLGKEQELVASEKDRMDALRVLKATWGKKLTTERDLRTLQECAMSGTGTPSCPSQ